ncbi:MAG: AAA family ATPase [Clostridiaceae bacterium]|nr:AAA family ATPase [Clostridiaceae bacterium]
MYNQNPILDLSTPEHFKRNIQKFLAEILEIPEYSINDRTPAGESLQVLVTLCLMIEARIIELARENKHKIISMIKKVANSAESYIIDLQINKGIKIDYIYELVSIAIPGSNRRRQIRCDSNNYEDIDDYIEKKVGCVILSIYKRRFNKSWKQVIQLFSKQYGLPYFDICDVTPVFSPKIEFDKCYSYYRDEKELTLIYDCFLDVGTETPICFPQLNTFLSFNYGQFPIYDQEIINKNIDSVIFIVESNKLADYLKALIGNRLSREYYNDIINSLERYENFIINENNNRYNRLSRRNENYQERLSNLPYKNISDAKNSIERMEKPLGYYFDKDLPVIFTSYIGEHPLFIPYSDWSSISGHKVFYVLKRKDDYLEKIVNIHKTLSEFEPENLYYVIVNDNVNTVNLNDTGIEVLTTTEALVRANEMDICLTDLNLHEQAKIYQDKRFRKREDFIIDNILDQKSILLISAKSGIGKSLFALNLGYAIAQKGSLICDWKVNRQAKVLYVGDDELDDRTLNKHLDKFDKLYRCKGNRKNFEYKQVRGFNLLTEEHRSEIHNYLNELLLNTEPKGNPVEILILDSLNKLCPGAETGAKWPKFYQWLRKLQDDFNNLSVILIHHAPKDKSVYYSGTSKIVDDVDVFIYLERNSLKSTDETVYQKDIIPLLINVKKNRRAPLDPRNHKYNLEWGNRPRWIGKDDDVLIWRGMEHEKKLELIIDYRKTKTAKEIGKIFNVSHKTIEKFVFENRDRIPTLQPGKRRNKK